MLNLIPNSDTQLEVPDAHSLPAPYVPSIMHGALVAF
jgi:hypothetical protein